MPRYDIILTVPIAGRITGTGKIDSSVRLQFFIVTAQIKTAFFQSHSDLLFLNYNLTVRGTAFFSRAENSNAKISRYFYIICPDLCRIK